jgi:ammonium transporter Rh
MFIEKD